MLKTYSFADAQRSLIKPFERPWFIVLFVLVTVLSLLGASYFINSQSSFIVLERDNRMQYGIASGIMTGSLLGATQWIVLRKYIPDWKWILVTVVSTTAFTMLSTAIRAEVEFMVGSGRLSAIGGTQLILISIISNLLQFGTFLLFGYLQWYVLQPYVSKARWWFFVPSIGILIFYPIFGIVFLFQSLTYSQLPLNMQILGLMMPPITQAICFCLLQKKPLQDAPQTQSPLNLAPDLINYKEVQMLREKLRSNISRIWKTDLPESIASPLSYLVGMNQKGEIVSYEPVNQAAIDHISQTPLPEVMSVLAVSNPETNSSEALAKFQIIFRQPCLVEIQSWRGIPLLWLGLGAYGITIVISLICGIFQIDLFSLQPMARP